MIQTSILVLAGLLPLFLVSSIIVGLRTRNYSSLKEEMSYLIYGELGRWQTANFLLGGLTAILLSYLLLVKSRESAHSVSLIALGAVAWGVTLILLRIFPTQERHRKTLVSHIHKLVFVGGVMFQSVIQLMFAIETTGILSTYFVCSSFITLIGLPLMIYYPDYSGLSQRLLSGAIFTWISFAAVLSQL